MAGQDQAFWRKAYMAWTYQAMEMMILMRGIKPKL